MIERDVVLAFYGRKQRPAVLLEIRTEGALVIFPASRDAACQS